MTTKEAVLRLIQEITLFTDRPDYCRPESVRKAEEFLKEEFKFTKEEMWSYAPEED